MALVMAFAALLAAAPQQPPVFKTEGRMVNLTVSVTEKHNRFVPNLTASDFSVYEDGMQRPIALFQTEELHLDLVIVVDTSASMRNYLPKVRVATQMLVNTLRPDDHVEVLTFSATVYRACPFTSDRAVIDNALNFITPEDDGSHIYRALADAFRELRAHDAERDRRRAVVLFTDGVDNDRLAADEEWLLRESSLADANVYVMLTPAPIDVQMKFPDPRDIFRKVAQRSGGSVFTLDTPYAVRLAFEAIGAELRAQYRIGYEPTERPGGGWRTILVHSRNGMAVKHKLKYYSPKAR